MSDGLTYMWRVDYPPQTIVNDLPNLEVTPPQSHNLEVKKQQPATIDVKTFVTFHALRRWCERVAEYGNASTDDVVAALQVSRLADKGETLIFRMAPNRRYYHHAASNCWFVVEQTERHVRRIVTVLWQENAPTSNSPTKKKRRKRMKGKNKYLAEDY